MLVADADAEARARHADALQTFDCEIVQASDGREALANALAQPPALLITELVLPIVDGYALCEIMRRDLTTSDVPILVVTTETRATAFDRARRAGATAVLKKPAIPSALRHEAERLLGRTDSPRERPTANADRPAASRQRQKPQMLSHMHRRFTTTTPPLAPPTLTCPSCDAALTYEQSHVGGVNERAAEQWDLFVCPIGCGRFEYRQRTRRVRRIG